MFIVYTDFILKIVSEVPFLIKNDRMIVGSSGILGGFFMIFFLIYARET